MTPAHTQPPQPDPGQTTRHTRRRQVALLTACASTVLFLTAGVHLMGALVNTTDTTSIIPTTRTYHPNKHQNHEVKFMRHHAIIVSDQNQEISVKIYGKTWVITGVHAPTPLTSDCTQTHPADSQTTPSQTAPRPIEQYCP